MAKNISQLPSDLKGMGRQVIEKFRQILPPIVSTEGLRHFEQSWDNQGFTNKSLSKWKSRKEPKYGKTKWGAKNAGRAILVSHQSDTKGTHLKDSLRVSSTPTEVVFATDKPYAQVHNEGGRAGRGKGFRMVKRQFMGPSEELNKKIAKKLDTELTKYFNSLK